MNVALFVYPNSADNWSRSSPVGGVVTDTFLIFPVTETTSSSGTIVLGRLIEMSNISKSVSIMENRGLDTKSDFTGVGGISKTGDFTVTLSNLDNMLDPFGFMGRNIKIFLAPDGTSIDEANCFFTGYVSNIDKSNLQLVLTVSDTLNRELNKEVGTEIKENEIAPINYGDFTEVEMKGVFDGDILDNKIVVDSKGLTTLSAISVYDKTSKTFFKLENPVLNDTNTAVEVGSLVTYKATICNNINASEPIINIYNPYYRAYLPSATITTLVKGDVYSLPTTPTVRATYVTSSEGYLIFTDIKDFEEISFTIPATGTLTKISGSGPATIDYLFASESLEGFITFDHSSNTMITTVEKPCFVQVDSEQILLVEEIGTELTSNNDYIYTTYRCVRGFNGSTASSHTAYTDIYQITQQDSKFVEKDVPSYLFNNKWLFTHLFEPDKLVFTQAGKFSVEGTIEDSLINLLSGEGILKITPSNLGAYGEYTFERHLTMLFPEIGLSGNVVNMYFQGDFLLNKNRMPSAFGRDLSISLCLGGHSVLKTDLDFTNNLKYLTGWSDSFLGSRTSNPLNYVGYSSSYYYYSNYRSVHASFEESGILNSVHYDFKSLERFNSYPANLLAHDYGGNSHSVIGTSFKTHTPAQNSNKEYSLKPSMLLLPTGNPEPYQWIATKDGTISNINMLSSTRYMLILKGGWYFPSDWQTNNSYGEGTTWLSFNITKPGFLITFAVDLAKEDIWLFGKGRLTNTDPVSTLSDLLYQEYGFDSISSDYPFTLNTTLSVYGQRRNLFSEIEKFCKQHGLILTQNASGQVLIRNALVEGINVTKTITNSDLAQNEWQQTYTSVDGLITSLVTKYCYRKASEEYLKTHTTEVYSNPYVTNSKTVTFKNEFVASDIDPLAESLLNFYKKPVRELKIYVKLTDQVQYKEGDWVKINSSYIFDTEDHSYLIVGVDTQLPIGTEPYVKLTVLELFTEDLNPSNNIVETPDSSEIVEHENTIDITE